MYQNLRLLYYSIVLISFLFLPIQSITSDESRHSPQAIDTFLQNLGFENYSAEIEKNLRNPPKLINKPGPIAKEVLEFNKDRYTIVNNARTITTTILSTTLPDIANPATRTRLIEFTARMLALQPQQITNRFPPEIEAIADEALKEEEKIKYLTHHIDDQIRQTAQSVFYDAANTIYGEKRLREITSMPKDSPQYIAFEQQLKTLQKQIHDYVYNMYLDPEVGKTRFLGRALSSGIVRESRLSKDIKLEEELSKAALKNGEYLENYVGDTVAFKDTAGRLQTAKIGHGNFIMEYSNGQQAAQLASAVTPGSISGRARSFKEGSLGNALLSALIPDETEMAEKATNKKLSWLDKRKLAYADSEYAKKGYSHLGLSVVKEDKSSGVKMAWAYDNYPNANRGGIRFVGIPDQFATQGAFHRFGTVAYDPEKFWEWAQAQYKEFGFRDIIWEASPMGKDGHPKEGAGKTDYKWKVEISKSEFEQLMSWPKEKAKEWFTTQIVPRIEKKFKEKMVSDGTAFAYGFHNVQGAAWCSQTVEQAYLQATGIDPLRYKDKWSMPVRVLKKIGSETVKDVDLDVRTTAPGSPAWQTPLIANHTSITFPTLSPLDSQLARNAPLPAPMNKRSALLLEQIFGLTSMPHELDPSNAMGELAGAVSDYELHRTLGNGSKFSGETQALRGTSGRLSSQTEPIDFSKNEKPLKQSPLKATEKSGFEKEARAFLMRLGFEDYSKMSSDSLKNKTYPTPVNEITLKENVRRYQMVNSARELSVLIMTEMQGRMKDTLSRERLINLAGSFLDLQPIEPKLEIPTSIKALPRGERERALNEYIVASTKEQIKQHSLKVTSDILETIYGEENIKKLIKGETVGETTPQKFTVMQKKVFGLVSQYMDRMYFDTQIGFSKFLGRSLSLLINRQSIKGKDPKLMKELNSAAAARGLYLENFIGDEATVNTEKGKVKLKFENGALVLDRSYDVRAAVIAATAIPGNDKLSKEMKLTGSLFDAAWVTNSTSNAPITNIERMREVMHQSETGTGGFSHVGYFNVFTDPETGIKNTLIIDSTPAANTDSNGGARINTLEQFASQADYSKVAVATYDHKKLHKFAVDYAKNHGLQENIFPATAVTADKNGKIVLDPKGTRQDWKALISKEEFEKLNSIKDPEEWYKEWSKRYMDHMRQVMTGQYGTYYGWPAETKAYTAGGSYCSQLGVLASMQATGIPIQETPDKYVSLVKLLHWFGGKAEAMGITSISETEAIKNAKNLPINDPIVAPSGLVAQPFIDKKKYKVADYPNRTTEQMAQDLFSPPYVEMNPELTRLITPGLAQEMQTITSAPISPSEKRARADAVLNRYAVRFLRGSHANVQNLLDPDKTIAERLKAGKAPTECRGYFTRLLNFVVR